jgi:hypothetical protein
MIHADAQASDMQTRRYLPGVIQKLAGLDMRARTMLIDLFREPSSAHNGSEGKHSC